MRAWAMTVLLLAACETKKAPPAATEKTPPPPALHAAPPPPPPVKVTPPRATAVEIPKPVHGVTTFEVGDEPTELAMVGDMLTWCDGGGGLSMMPSHGGDVVELSTQQDSGNPKFDSVVAFGDKLVAASSTGDLSLIDLSRMKKRPFGIEATDESFYALASDGEAIYAATFTALTVERITTDGKRTKLLAGQIEPVVRGKTLYGSDYRSGRILSIPTAGGRARTIARVSRVTGFTVDDKFIYAWSESDKHLKKISLASGKVSDIWRTGLETTDTLAQDGDWIYCSSWPDEHTWQFMRIAKDGHEMQVLADGLTHAGPILISSDAVFLAARTGDDDVILRFDKGTLEPTAIVKPN